MDLPNPDIKNKIRPFEIIGRILFFILFLHDVSQGMLPVLILFLFSLNVMSHNSIITNE